jgi:hypothetical protein
MLTDELTIFQLSLHMSVGLYLLWMPAQPMIPVGHKSLGFAGPLGRWT